MDGLRDKVIIIAGGATGIGAATARKLAVNGARVVIGDFNEKGAMETAAAITAAGGVASAFAFDITDERSIQDLFAYTVARHGRVDGLHNNAADFKAMETDTNIVEVSLATWDRTFKVDLVGYLLTMRQAIPLMLKQGGGSIVNTSTAAAFSPMAALPAYAAAKAGVVALSKHVAVTYGRQGIRCNTVAPGVIPTESAKASGAAIMAGLKEVPAWINQLRHSWHSNRGGAPEDIAAAVSLLLSDEGSWINGQSLNVDGGWVMR